ncbi:MAG: TetR/AcrR family transcriptional regulator [Pseudomonadota bacterium]
MKSTSSVKVKKVETDPFSRDDQRQVKVDAIVAAAARLIHDHGVSGTSLDDVADALGVTKPSVYYYVKNKEELVYLCHMRIVERQSNAINIALSTEGSGAEKVKAFIKSYAAFVWAPDSGLPRLWQDTTLKPKKRKAVNKAYFAEADRLIEIINNGISDGSLYPHDAEVMERALLSSILWVPIWYSAKMAAYDEESLLAELMNIFFNGISPK